MNKRVTTWVRMATLAFLLLVLSSVGLPADDDHGVELELRKYKIGGGVAIQLHVPKDWKQKVTRGGHESVVNIALSPRKKQRLKLLITGMAGPAALRFSSDPVEMQVFVQAQMERLRNTAVPGNMKLFKFQADAGLGFMFSSIDKDPQKGEYSHLLQGVLPLAPGYMINFTILSNDSEAPEVKAALELLKGAVYKAGE